MKSIFSKKNNEFTIDAKLAKQNLRDASNKLAVLAKETKKQYDKLEHRTKKKIFFGTAAAVAIVASLIGLSKYKHRKKR